jgi:hypothetical protein
MIYKRFQDINFNKSPIIIFGSGPAGLSLALDLEKKKINSIVIEAGGEDFDENSQKIYKSKFTAVELTDASVSRLRQLGGTSGHWGGWSKPFEDHDFDKWPININDLNPYKEETCQILNIKNQFRRSNINSFFNQIEFQYSEVRFAEKYKDHIQKSKYIDLLLDTQLLYLSGKNKNIEYAVCINNDKKISLSSKFFILACGGIENSRILLWTKEKSQEILNNNKNIGNYWMTHSWILAGSGLLSVNKLKNKLNDYFLNYEGPIHFSTKKNFSDIKNITSAGLYMDAQEDKKFYKEAIKDLLCVAPEFGKKFARMLFNKDLKCGNIFMHIEDSPNKNNKITLDIKELDKFDMPITNINYERPISVIKTAKNVMSEFAEFCRKDSIGRIAMHEDIFNLKKLDYLGEYHHMGGTRMGENLNNSVVDKNLKVHDINNLFVAGSSVFPTCGFTNPTFTIIQLSIRLSNHMKNTLQL